MLGRHRLGRDGATAACPGVPKLSYCGDQVRRHDHDRYLTALLAPADRREALFALYAFNLEVARTRELVSEPMLGEIRLQWWRDAVAEMFAGKPRRHEVIGPLAAAVSRFALGRDHFGRLIEARARDLDAAPFDDLAALEDYAEGTSATLTWLALQVLGARDAAASAAGRHIGIAWALVGLMRALPFHRALGRATIPASFGVAADDRRALRRAVAAICARAREHLDAARQLRGAVDRLARAALLPGILADLYLNRLAAAGHDPYAAVVAAPVPSRAWRLLLATWRGRY
jgi:phytoene synthase